MKPIKIDYRFAGILLLLLVTTAVLVSARSLFEPSIKQERQASVLENIVTFENMGQSLAGTLAQPTTANPPYPVVLLLTGFTGERDGLPISNVNEGMFTRTARALASAGYASLRIDFRGSGASEGNWSDTSFSGQISDAIAALDYLETQEVVDSSRIGVIGFSQGGLVAAGMAARDPRVDTVVLWSAVSNPHITYTYLLGAETVAAGLRTDAPLDVLLPWGATIRMSRPFFEDIYRVNPVAEISSYAGPLLVIGGEHDMTVAPMPYAAEVFLEYHDGQELLVMVDADHVLNVDSAGTAVFDEVINHSLTWIQETL